MRELAVCGIGQVRIQFSEECFMPITLPPISRRRFLGSSLAGAAAAAMLAQWLRAADAPIDPHRFVLISDIHIDADRTFAKSETNVWNTLQQPVGEGMATPTALR